MTISIWWFLGILVWAIVATVFTEVAYARSRKTQIAYEGVLQYLHRPLTVQELAAQKRVHPSTISKLIRKGEIKAEKVGRQWRISQGGE